MSDLEAGQLQVCSCKQVQQPAAAADPQASVEAADWSDWKYFGVGWFCGIAWVVGTLRPLSRYPRFPATRNLAGWIANVIGEQLLGCT